MLEARPSKRTGAEHFANDMRFDIVAGERTLGRLVSDRKRLGAAFDLDGSTFSVEHTPGAESELVYQAVARLVTRAPKPQPDRYELKDAGGAVLAMAEQTREVFSVSLGEARYCFAKGRSRLLFDLTRDGEARPLGAVGQRRFWTIRMHMDLPDALPAAFQVFLLALLLALITQRAQRSDGIPPVTP
jgi:hypothetical protein